MNGAIQPQRGLVASAYFGLLAITMSNFYLLHLIKEVEIYRNEKQHVENSYPTLPTTTSSEVRRINRRRAPTNCYAFEFAFISVDEIVIRQNFIAVFRDVFLSDKRICFMRNCLKFSFKISVSAMKIPPVI